MLNTLRSGIARLGIACLRIICFGIIALGLAPGFSAAVAKPVLTTLYTFAGGADGSMPSAGVTADPQGSGALFGTTAAGGAANDGTVFKLTPSGSVPWPKTVLHEFQGGSADGNQPLGELLIDPNDGAIYGTTLDGGLSFSGEFFGIGTVFRLKPPVGGGTPWDETIIANFSDPSRDGYHPSGGLVFETGGGLIGTASVGGQNNAGVLYLLTPPVSGNGLWRETPLHQFLPSGFTDGIEPDAGVATAHGTVRGPNDALYGTTFLGGTANLGSVYMVKPVLRGWRETLVHSFAGGADDGSRPSSSLVVASDGSLFGTTGTGGLSDNGTVFQLTPVSANQRRWKQRILHKFEGSPNDGLQPNSGLVAGSNGAFYGTTYFGGIGGGQAGTCPSGCGVVFELTPIIGTPRYRYKVLHFFTGAADGARPQGVLVVDKAQGDTLYGTTEFGGAATGLNGFGTVFKLTH